MKVFFTLSLLLIQTLLFSQNLLPNGTFESTTNLDYTNPATSFDYLDYWYPASQRTSDSLKRGTPDLFDYNNQWPLSDPRSFWNSAVAPFDGNHHVGIANFAGLEGYFYPESVCTSISEPLEAGAYYHVEFQSRNKGTAKFSGEPATLCLVEDDKHFKILLDSDSIFITIDEDNKDSYFAVDKEIELHSESMEGRFLGGWDNIGSCFQSDGNENFFGITMTVGQFEVNDPCVIYEYHWETFYVHYFDIDDVKLTKLPSSLSFNETVCVGRDSKINIAVLADLPVMQNEIEYHWDDGRVDSINFISKAGTYHVDAIIDCTSISITLEVEDYKCIPDIFIPTVFSPNNDGINDVLETFVSVDFPILFYQFSIYDRWGTLIFETNDVENKWQGVFNGKELDDDLFVWTLDISIDDPIIGLANYKQKGEVAILK